MAHSLTGRCGNSGDVTDHRLCHIFFDKSRSLLFSRTSYLTYHDYSFRCRVLLKQREDVNKMTPWDRIPSDPDAGALPKASISSLLYRFISQGARTRDNAHFTGQMDIPRHDPYFAGSRGNNPRTIRPNHPRATDLKSSLHGQHI